MVNEFSHGAVDAGKNKSVLSDNSLAQHNIQQSTSLRNINDI
jgi:hypothetical protein